VSVTDGGRFGSRRCAIDTPPLDGVSCTLAISAPLKIDSVPVGGAAGEPVALKLNTYVPATFDASRPPLNVAEPLFANALTLIVCGRKLASPGYVTTIAFAPIDGYRVIARRPYDGWLGMHRAEIVTLERISGTSG